MIIIAGAYPAAPRRDRLGDARDHEEADRTLMEAHVSGGLVARA